MRENYLKIISAFALLPLALSSCDTPTGQGAGYGAAAGAIIGGAATGRVRGAAVGDEIALVLLGHDGVLVGVAAVEGE